MTQTIDVAGGRIHYETMGHGPRSVVCLHGNSSAAGAFRPLAAALGEAFTLHLLDFPGHGGSQGGEVFRAAYSFQGLKEILLRWLDRLDLRPDGIIGHSMGGHIAAQAARDIPSLRFLVLLSSPPIAGVEGVARFFRPTAPTADVFAETLDDTAIDRLVVAFTHAGFDPARAAAVAARIRATDGVFRDALGKSLAGADVVDEAAALAEAGDLELLLIGGERDGFIRPDYFDWVATRLPHRRKSLLVLPESGHSPHLEATAKTADAILARFGGAELGRPAA